ncbi:MAG TPA: UvrD-helicase domain-containing protein [Ktedonobacterales bacterium]|nr:UvrD-helicase domain-containing protein [Ktedonobacterales bacterium]
MTTPTPDAAGPVDLLAGLNQPQREAVTTTEGPLLVFAGPGSGKTRVITHRMAWLVRECDVLPWNVLAVTFTNKAAAEMKERLEKLIGSSARDVAVGTFHAICARVLRRDVERSDFGLNRYFVIYDDDDQIALVKRILLDMQFDPKQFNPRMIHSIISRAKNDLLSPAEFAKTVNRYPDEIAARVFARYDEQLRANNAVDFDDLILLTWRLWYRYPDILAEYQRRYRYVHVDEFQDTNPAQYELVKLLAAGTAETPGHTNICAVGDDDQCLVAGTQITMGDGSLRDIEDVVAGDEVLSAYGTGDFRPACVLSTARRAGRATGIAITTRAGRRLISTPEHIHFAGYRLGMTPQLYFTYLMYKRGIGYRLGTSQVYTRGQKEPVVGIEQRVRHEHADALWVLSTHQSENDARADEYILSLKYRIPTLPFVPRKGGSLNGLVHDERYIRRVFDTFDTQTNASRLMSDMQLSSDYPHVRPRSRNSNRYHIVITLCGDRRGPTPMHRISLVGNDSEARATLESLGLSIRAARAESDGWRHESANKSMAALFEIAKRISAVLDADIVLKARLGKNGESILGTNSLPFIPAASVQPGMVMFDALGGYDLVESVEVVPLYEPVYDLNIEGTHNFIANGIVTHNSIYGWRGANPEVVRDFQRDFPTMRVILLEQNYRSTQNILDAAQGVVRRNTSRRDKQLFTERGGGEKITVHEAYNEEDEAGFVVNEIRRLVARGVCELRDCAVMYRTNAQSRALEEQFIRSGLRYVVVGSKKFYERREVKDLLAYLRLLLNPADTASLQRIINVPARKIGPKTLNELLTWAEQQGLTPMEALRRVEEHPTLTTGSKRALTGFAALMDSLGTVARERPLPEVIDQIVLQSGYAMEIRDGTDEGEDRWNNVQELRRVASDFAEMEPETALPLFLENVALVGGADTAQTGESGTLASEEQRHDAVTLITLHAAKGLEFPVVFVVGLEEGILPHARSMESQRELEEERRLAYVGITRAMTQLYLLRAFRRSFFGGNAMMQEPSRFLDEIPRQLVNVSRQRSRGETGGTGGSGMGGPARDRGLSGQSPATLAGRSGATRGLGAARGNESRGESGGADAGAEPAATNSQWAATASETASVSLAEGDRVIHRLFGRGLVLSVSDENGAQTAEVLFETAGKKTLDLNFARLEKI